MQCVQTCNFVMPCVAVFLYVLRFPDSLLRLLCTPPILQHAFHAALSLLLATLAALLTVSLSAMLSVSIHSDRWQFVLFTVPVAFSAVLLSLSSHSQSTSL
jgi:hypothetical protein